MPASETADTTGGVPIGFLSRRSVQLVVVGLAALVAGIGIGSAGVKNSPAGATPVGLAAVASHSAQHGTAPGATSRRPAAPQVAAPRRRTPAAPRAQISMGASTDAPRPVSQKVTVVPVATTPSDKGWLVQSLIVKRDFVGAFTGTVRLTNSNDTPKSGAFTITLLRDGQQIGVLQGTADDVAIGKTVTVDLVSDDTYSAGAFTYDFQADISV